jgi:hypothetical protein
MIANLAIFSLSDLVVDEYETAEVTIQQHNEEQHIVEHHEG